MGRSGTEWRTPCAFLTEDREERRGEIQGSEVKTDQRSTVALGGTKLLK